MQFCRKNCQRQTDHLYCTLHEKYKNIQSTLRLIDFLCQVEIVCDRQTALDGELRLVLILHNRTELKDSAQCLNV